VHAGQLAVEEIRDDPRFARAEYVVRDLPARREADARQGRMAAAARHLELELVGLPREHDEAPLGAAHLDG
jgi:hypothetical protein